MNGRLGIWIDRKQAIIVAVTRDHSAITRLRSSIRPHADYHGAQDGGGEKRYEERHEQQMAHFLDAVTRHVERGDEVFVLGPGEAKKALVRRISGIKSLSGVTATVRPADKLTEAQLVATVRRRYRLPR